MRMCSLKDLEPGMILGRSIYQLNGKLLLGAGFRINPEVSGKLQERGINHIYVMEEGTDDVVPEDVISEEIKMHAKLKLADKVQQIRNQSEFKDISVEKAKRLVEEGYLKKLSITYDMRNIVEEILKDISATGAKYMNMVMVKSSEGYFFEHALNVTVLAILIGRKYRFDQKELMSLALGCFLHDIGKVVLEHLKGGNELHKEGHLYKEHPTFGYLLLNDNPDISPIETQIVNQHHEYQDGKGFPIGLSGQNISPIKTVVRETKGHIFRLAEICCLVNAFDKMVYNPFSQEEMTTEQVVKSIIMDAGTKYNKDIVETLLKVVPFYPVGSSIKVVDIVDPSLIGYRGVVAKINENNINRPIIILTKNKFLKKIKPIVIDTSKFKHIDLRLIV